MKIKLNPINTDLIIRRIKSNENIEFPLSIQYVDFNVLNYLYENKSKLDDCKNIFFYPDSSALYFYLKISQKINFEKIISTDLQNNLLSAVDKNQMSIYLFGDTDSILESAIKSIKKKYLNVNIVGSYNGYNFIDNDVISQINKSQIDILFVGLGVGRQEKWILENHKKINVKVIMSVGGWFQYLAENKKRAPLFLRKIHLEWFYKFILEFPRVWKRYLIGIPKFYYRVITKKTKIRLDEK